jgi:hypothetical protein
MKGINIREWSFLDWTGALCFAAGALIPAINATLKDAPEFAAIAPAFLGWVYLPPVLMLVTFGVILFRLFENAPRKTNGIATSGLRPRAFPKHRYEPESDFALLPQHFTVDLAAQFPHIEVCFFAVSFLPRPIKLTEVDLSLQLYGAAALEDIRFRQKDWQVDPKDYEVVTCRRNLTDLERTNLPWQTGRVTAAFQLSAKATDGDKTLSYGPVSSKVIEGWVSVPLPPPRPSTRI